MAEELLGHVRAQVRIGAQRVHLLGLRQERDHAVADEIRRGLEPGEEQQRRERVQLFVREAVRFVGRCILVGVLHDQAAQQVVLRTGAPLLDQCVEERVALEHRRVGGVEHVARRSELEHRGERLRQHPELRAVLGRDAEQGADHADRELERELLHQLARIVLEHRVEEVVDHLLDLRAEQVDGARRELAHHEPSEPRVHGTVEVEHRPRAPLEPRAGPPSRRAHVERLREVLLEARIAKCGLAIVVARQQPRLELLAAEHGCELA